MNAAPLLIREQRSEVFRLVLNRPERHNALVPGLLAALHAGLDEARALDPRVMVLTGAGRSFSTGGDVHGFAAVPRSDRRAYAEGLVGALHEAILKLVDLPFPVVCVANGAVTGGAFGLALASDIVLMAHEAFIAPYYSEVGFSPDGGWTVLLPERIGPMRAGAIQMLNRRLDAETALELGLATDIAALADLEAAEGAILDRLLTMRPSSLAATKALLWRPERRTALAEGLARELECFLTHIDRQETEAGMAAFLARTTGLERRS
jgi:2-(1,2-epoxy-1,2-dihydrophenyl)acetyl-CoA isomerase